MSNSPSLPLSLSLVLHYYSTAIAEEAEAMIVLPGL